MKDSFHRRWTQLTQAARTAPFEAEDPLPLGFTTRLLANYRSAPSEPWNEWLTVLGLRAAAASALLFAASLTVFFATVDPVSLATQWFETPLPAHLLLP